jgi:hypothetical protein
MTLVAISELPDLRQELLDLVSIPISPKFCTLPDEHEWIHILGSSPIPDSVELHQDSLCRDFASNPWTWDYDSDHSLLILTLFNCDSSSIYEISQNRIRSRFLSGDWWAPISDISIINSGSNTRIQFRTSRHFPVLVRYGEMIDLLSAFYLGVLSLNHLKSDHWFLRWLRFAAFRGEQNSQHTLGIYFNGLQQTDEAVYWLARAVLEHSEPEAKLRLAVLLTELSENGPLAEHLLIELANEGRKEALNPLAELMSSGSRGLPPQIERAREIAAVARENQEREQGGEGGEGGGRREREAGERRNVEQTQIQPNESSSEAFWDIVAASGLVMTVATGAFFVVRRIWMD